MDPYEVTREVAGELPINACRQLFGGQCTTSRISEELLRYSDHRLHDFALRHKLHSFLLGEEAVMSSAKCQLMVELLKDLQVQCLCTYHQSVLSTLLNGWCVHSDVMYMVYAEHQIPAGVYLLAHNDALDLMVLKSLEILTDALYSLSLQICELITVVQAALSPVHVYCHCICHKLSWRSVWWILSV